MSALPQNAPFESGQIVSLKDTPNVQLRVVSSTYDWQVRDWFVVVDWVSEHKRYTLMASQLEPSSMQSEMHFLDAPQAYRSSKGVTFQVINGGRRD